MVGQPQPRRLRLLGVRHGQAYGGHYLLEVRPDLAADVGRVLAEDVGWVEGGHDRNAGQSLADLGQRLEGPSHASDSNSRV